MTRALAAGCVVSVVVLAAALAGCRRGELAVPSAETPVFLISIDTLRSDHLPAYGYKGTETPHIDALRADAVLYERAYSHTPLTLPSHASMLTGVLPAEHGVRDNMGYQLAPDVQTVAELLKARGYATGAAVSAYVLRREGGLARGFDLWDDSVESVNPGLRSIGLVQRDGMQTVAVAKQWLAKQRQPVFFLLHLYEPHTPYTPPPAHDRFASKYDGEIAYADEILGSFLQSLKDAGLYDQALIVLTSDHGEGLGDHGEDEHGVFLYREAIQVPLIVKYPRNGFAGKSVAAPAQLIDLVPTILERTGIAAPAKLAGESLAALAAGKSSARPVYSESWYPRFHFGWTEQHSLIDGDRHYIQSAKPELYSLRDDPAEKKNILAEDRRGLFAAKAAIAPFIREAAGPANVDPEEAAKLAALGYLGATVSTKAGEVLPDPKDEIGMIEEMGSAFGDYRAKRYAAALAKTSALLERNPRITDLFDLKAKILIRLGRRDEAIQAAQEGMRIAPHANQLALELAQMLLDAKRYDEARQHAELAVKSDPGAAHDVLARVSIEQKDLARADAEAQLAVQSANGRVAPLLTLARVRREQGRLDEALASLDEAARRKRPNETVMMLHVLRGDVLARLGRFEEAEAELKRELALFPDEPLAYKHLVLMYVTQGRLPEGTALLRKLIEESPTPPSYIAVCEVLQTVGDTAGVRYWARKGLQQYPTDRALRRLAG